MQITTTMRYHLSPIKMDIIKKSTNSKCWMCVGELSHAQLFATPWTVAHQAPLSIEFSRQAYWSGLPFLFCRVWKKGNPPPPLVGM